MRPGRKSTRGAGPLPAERVRFEFAREFSAAEFAKVKAGFPPDWDAKWGITYREPLAYFLPLFNHLCFCRLRLEPLTEAPR